LLLGQIKREIEPQETVGVLGMDEKELIEKYSIDIESLKKEQIKLAKGIKLRDSMDFSLATRFGAVENICIGNKIISAIIVCDKDFNIIEQQYFLDKLKFPYLHGFRSYRELPSMISTYNKLQEKPEVVFIHGHGTCHPRLGLASHFSLSTNVPSIGIAGELFEEDEIADNAEDILLDGKKAGKVLQSKEKANPLFVSPGSGISIETALNLAKSMVKAPHKLPEPLHLAHRYVREVKDELKLV